MNKIVGYFLFTFSLAAQVEAASFDCEKASNLVEKTICTDDELSQLDERMAGLYETALLDEKIAGTVKQAQKQWLKKRNSCSDVACVKNAYETRMREIFPDIRGGAALPPRKFQASLDSKDWVVVFTDSKIGEARAVALRNLNNQDHPDRQKYNEIGLRDSSSAVRGFAASFYHIELYKLTPILLKVIASDSNQRVRFNAAINLSCQFTCNGAEYTEEDIQALEENLSLVESALKNRESEDMGNLSMEKELLHMLDFIWCDMTPDSQRKLSKLLSTDLTIRLTGLSQDITTPELNFLAKWILNENPENLCE